MLAVEEVFLYLIHAHNAQALEQIKAQINNHEKQFEEMERNMQVKAEKMETIQMEMVAVQHVQ